MQASQTSLESKVFSAVYVAQEGSGRHILEENCCLCTTLPNSNTGPTVSLCFECKFDAATFACLDDHHATEVSLRSQIRCPFVRWTARLNLHDSTPSKRARRVLRDWWSLYFVGFYRLLRRSSGHFLKLCKGFAPHCADVGSSDLSPERLGEEAGSASSPS